jgi:hypothetical protein
MMEMTGGDVLSPHERDHADHRQNKQTDENQSWHEYSLGSGTVTVKVGLTVQHKHPFQSSHCHLGET